MSARTIAQLRRQQLLAQRAAAMRAAPTRSERVFWEAVRARRLQVEVRRQVVLGEFIADFFVPSARLVIEIDGGYHRRRVAADARRERALRRLGYRVLRLEAELVVTALPVALRRLRDALVG
ncbi:MAG: endonuclease domain-containing protein [Polyangiaceae bacterium]|nr:endonuclease domain-containing protein [Polyangiaceae bacterium]